MMSGISSQIHDAKPILLDKPLNIIITHSHRFTCANRAADKAVLLKHKALGHFLLRRPFHFAPPEVQGDQYQLGPKALGQYIQRKCTPDLFVWQKGIFGPSRTAWKQGRGVLVKWFTAAQQRHILLQRVGVVPTMTGLERRVSYFEVAIPGWFCGQPDTRQHGVGLRFHYPCHQVSPARAL